MGKPLVLAALLASTFAAPPPLAAQPAADREDRRRCSVHGFAFGAESVPVWAEPSDSSEPVGTLPPPDPGDDSEGQMSSEFDVVEARGGWFRIENGRAWGDTLDAPLRPVSGWISGRYVAFSLQTEMGFAEPDPRSAVRYRSRDRIQPHMLVALDCRGEWVKLLFSDGGEIREGWFRGVCGIQETSCDSLVGDRYRD